MSAAILIVAHVVDELFTKRIVRRVQRDRAFEAEQRRRARWLSD